MKAALSEGKSFKVDVNFKIKEIPQRSGTLSLRATELVVELPDGEKLVAEACCHSKDPFCKANGRYAAVLRLFKEDNERALNKFLEQNPARQGMSKFHEQANGLDSLAVACRRYMKLSRPIRTAIFKIVCPQFSYNAPERKMLREKSLYERLHRKYGQPAQPAMSLRTAEDARAVPPEDMERAAK